MTPETIKKKVEQYFNLTDISDPNRNGTYTLARFVYFRACFKMFYPKMSLDKISKVINRTHATALHYKSKRMNTQERVLYNDFEKNCLGTVDQLQEQVRTKKNVIATNSNTLINNYRKLEKEISKMQEKKQTLDIIPASLVKKLSQLPEGQKQAVLERFSIIVDMELKKVFTYREKRLNGEMKNN
jgi:Zn-dependent oligopeptidase